MIIASRADPLSGEFAASALLPQLSSAAVSMIRGLSRQVFAMPVASSLLTQAVVLRQAPVRRQVSGVVSPLLRQVFAAQPELSLMQAALSRQALRQVSPEWSMWCSQRARVALARQVSPE